MKLKPLVLVLSGLFCATAMAADATTPLATDMDKISYSIGVDLGRNIKKQGLDLSMPALSKGLEDGYKGSSSLMTDAQMKEVLMNFQKDFVAKRNAEIAEKAQKNLKDGQAFLDTNKKQSGVVTLPSGLQYKIKTAGKGEKPGADDTVTVDYEGRLINGKVFDSSDKQGHPISFKVNQVIPGWTEILQLMPVGSTWEVFIPASLAYGAQAVGPMIGPNETLIFNIHLISVQKKK
ncbi:MAG: FKBP-type peptidyl-prolyl cis-trans isomerase [Gammaproteobacteria bacterium]|nr:FKBP-type peptidyl-prolyl cis-trans isomerase [Gammaproteobacteria bacterium]